MNFPSELKYSKDHEWIRIDGTTAFIGITEFAQSELGDIVYVDVPSMGKTLQKEEVFGTIEAVKTVSDLFMPVSGTLLEINSELDNQPELVNNSPYEKGWIVKITITDASEIEHLLDAQAYKNLIGK